MTAKRLYIITLVFEMFCSMTFTVSRSFVGVYLPGIDLLYCTSEKTCIYEQGHRMDWSKGHISSNSEFRKVVLEFPEKHPENPWSSVISGYTGTWEEMYAQMWESVGGNVNRLPVEFQIYFIP